MDNLTIYEKLFLILMRDREGTIPFGVQYQFGIAGAIIAELFLNNCIKLQKKRWGLFVVPNKNMEPQDPLLLECYRGILTKKRHATIKTWINRFANLKHLKVRIGRQLVKKNILKEKEEKILYLFKRHLFPEVNPIPEQQLNEKLRYAVQELDRADEEDLVLLTFLYQLNVLKYIFPQNQVKEMKTKIKSILSDVPVGEATGQAIQEMQAIIIAAAVLPAIMTTTSISS